MTNLLQSHRAFGAIVGLAIVLTGCSSKNPAPATATSSTIAADLPSSEAPSSDAASSSASESPTPSSSPPEASSAPASSSSAASSPASSAPAPSPTTAASPAPEVLLDFQAADTTFATAFLATSTSIQKARRANNLPGAQAGGRALRDALFTLDASLRKINFTPAQAEANSALLSAIGLAIAALDAQNITTNQAAYKKGDGKSGEGLRAVTVALVKMRQSLGLPPLGPQPPALPASANPSSAPASRAPSKFVTKQRPLPKFYVEGNTITDAKAWRDDLLAVGSVNVNAKNTYAATRSYSFGITEAWVGAFPLLLGTGVVGSGVEPPPSGISGFTVLPIDSKNPVSATNPEALPFAVLDAAGTCAAGVLFGADLPKTGKALTLPAGSPCTGNAAREAAVAAGFQ